MRLFPLTEVRWVDRQTGVTRRERGRELFLIVNMNEASRISEAVLATAPEPAPVLPRIGTSWRLTFPARARRSFINPSLGE